MNNITMRRGLLLIVLLQGMAAGASPARPFPQSQDYGAGVSVPNQFSSPQLNQHVVDYYQAWKADYLLAAGKNAVGHDLFRIAFGRGSSATVSEGQGYGMVIVALMVRCAPGAIVPTALIDTARRAV